MDQGDAGSACWLPTQSAEKVCAEEGQGPTTCCIFCCFPPQPASVLQQARRAAAPRGLLYLLLSASPPLQGRREPWFFTVSSLLTGVGISIIPKGVVVWYTPPGPRLIYSQPPSSPDAFFQRRFFL
ncbi:hypothetical protein CHARACLAT_016782 [Characodon lateralis]|uniref:Uncharacterized protein n=1 Tax=Characodon lateralis TaxID=208331 RepID=A0ABU7DRP7_9TELE|nr:hypothetical protein [Characodon lateralis]